MQCLNVKNLTKYYGEFPALASVSLVVPAGERLVVTGENGAGKSTLLKCISGLIRPDAGEIVFGELAETSTERNPLSGSSKRLLKAKQPRLGILTSSSMLYGALSVIENLELYAGLYRLSNAGVAIADLLQRVNLSAERNKAVGQLSDGQRQRAALARALLHQPELLVFDEPFTHLDTIGHQMLFSVLEEYQVLGRTVILSVHEPRIIEQLAGRKIVLANGRVISEHAADQLPPAGNGHVSTVEEGYAG